MVIDLAVRAGPALPPPTPIPNLRLAMMKSSPLLQSQVGSMGLGLHRLAWLVVGASRAGCWVALVMMMHGPSTLMGMCPESLPPCPRHAGHSGSFNPGGGQCGGRPAGHRAHTGCAGHDRAAVRPAPVLCIVQAGISPGRCLSPSLFPLLHDPAVAPFSAPAAPQASPARAATASACPTAL